MQISFNLNSNTTIHFQMVLWNNHSIQSVHFNPIDLQRGFSILHDLSTRSREFIYSFYSVGTLID